MKIAINCRFLIRNKLEGLGWYTYEVVKRLVEQHPADEFLLLFDRPYPETFIFGSNVTPLVLRPPARHPLLWWWWFEVSVAQALSRHRPDVFFSPDGYLSLQSRVPTVMVTHDIAHVHYPDQVPWLVRKYYDHFVPRFLAKAGCVATVSEFSRQDILTHYPIAPEKVVVIPNGCRSTFAPVAAAERQAVRSRFSAGTPYFFYLGAVHPRKNLGRLLQAFDAFRQQSGSAVKLLVAGRLAWQTREVQELWQTLASREAVVFLGYVPEQELPKILGSALAMVYVSLFEGFGLPVLEAMHAEVPAITSNTSALAEVGSGAALLVDPTDVPSITDAMLRIYGDEHLRESLIEQGRIKRKEYNWDQTAEDVYKICRKVAGQK